MTRALIPSPPSSFGGSSPPPEQNPVAQYLARLTSAASRRTVSGVLDRAARIFAALDRNGGREVAGVTVEDYPWSMPGALSYAKVQAAVSILAKTGAPTARLACSALKQVARFAFNLGQLDAAERMRIDDVRPPKLSGKAKGRRLTPREVERLYRACAADATPLGRRDAALFAIAIGGGARRFELSALDVADYQRPARLGRDPVEITVRAGKGGKHATIVAPPDVAEAVEAWLSVRGRHAGPLFHSSRGRGRGLEADSRLSSSGVYAALLRRGGEARIVPQLTPHDLRRTAITIFLERSGDLALAQRFSRHSDPKTTAKYDHREHDALRKAVANARTGFQAN